MNQENENTAWRIRNGRLRSGLTFFSVGTPAFGWRLLTFILLLIYVPFLGERVVRPAGDDKVYVSQAIEMANQGNWFVQTLGGEPNYYKGPLHYLFLRVGMGVFGSSIWATVYMNLILVILAAIALGAVVQRSMKEFEGWPFWAGMAFAASSGIYSHVFASQMEVETAAFFVFGLYFLDRAGPGKADLKFWIIAGLAGWLKSPLHSVLLGCTALIFWAWQGELWPRLRNPGAWLAVIIGVLVCAAGYLPAFLLDRENFVATYVFRETLDKPGNGSTWYHPILPLFTFSIFPWMFPAIVAYADGLSRIWRRGREVRTTAGSRRLVALGIALMIPSILFFLIHPYRGQNYNLPVVGGLVLAIAAIWATRSEGWSRAYSFSLGLTAALFLLIPAGLTYFTRHYDPMPFWWPSYLLPVLWIGALLSARGFWREGVTFGMARPASLSRRVLWFFVALGCLLSTIGERELIDVRDRLYQAKKAGEIPRLAYYNLQKNIWSEWGYLNFQIPYPVTGLFNREQLAAAARNGEIILVPGDEWLNRMKEDLAQDFPTATWEIDLWKRWKTKGRNAEGKTTWRESWEKRDLSVIEKNFYMVRVKP